MPSQSRHPSFRRIASLAACIAALAVAPSAAATETSAEVCWLNTDDDSYECFDTYDEFAAASGIGSARASLDGGVQPLATYTLATFYENASYGGSSTYITTSNSSLCSGYHYYGSAMPSGWNDRVSSFTTAGTCRVKLWANTGYSGSTYGPADSASSLGAMNDEASSYQIYVP